MKKSETVWINRGWQNVNIGFVPSKKAWNNEMKKLEIKNEPYPNSDASCTQFKKGSSKICLITVKAKLEKEIKLSELMGLICHECVHVWQFVCEDMQETNPGWEIEAYSIQAIFQDVFTAFQETRSIPKLSC